MSTVKNKQEKCKDSSTKTKSKAEKKEKSKDVVKNKPKEKQEKLKQPLESKLKEKPNILRQSVTTKPKEEGGRIDFKNYHRYETINNYLKRVVKENRGISSLETIGYSVEGREINLVKVSLAKYNKRRPIIFVDAGIHAREWIAPATALYLIHQLLENRKNSYLYRDFDWYITPLVNPDGYEYSHTKDRFWRKNRAKNSSIYWGVDLNRNYGYKWGLEGSSPFEYTLTYRGKQPFSEPESRAIRDLALKCKKNIKLYLTLHSYGQMFLHPWGYTTTKVKDLNDLVRVARAANRAIKAVKGTPYKIGSSADLLHLMSGGSKDYFAAEMRVKYSYTIELPGGGTMGFDLPPEKIERVVKEMFAGFRGFWEEMDRIYSQM